MRIAPDLYSIPPAVYKFLQPDERQVVVFRLHPARLVPPLATATGGLLAAVAVSPIDRGDLPVELTVWLVAGLLIAQSARAVLDWLSRYLVATSRRFFMVDNSGITVEFRLPKIESFRLRRSVAGRIFGFGTLIFDSARVAFDYVPYPEQFYLELLGLLYRNFHDEEE